MVNNGGAFKIDKLPKELTYRKTGGPGHYEIVPRKSMSAQEFQELLYKIIVSPFGG